MPTTTCARGIEIEVMLLPVRLNRTLQLKNLRKSLHLAADRVNLGVDYFVGKITFLP
ncbi:MAG: hypothetical protein PHU21_04855 [Elusimicrobia bacterium]|nr:hypothetical protein [Elusimicrobiota bacterium]